MPRPQKRDVPVEQCPKVLVRMQPDVKDRMKAAAQITGKSMNDIAVEAVESWLGALPAPTKRKITRALRGKESR